MGKVENDLFWNTKIDDNELFEYYVPYKHGWTHGDRIRIAKLYFLESFPLPQQESSSIEWDHVLMVGDDELFDSYHWGRIAFDLLLEFMNRLVSSKGKTGIFMGGFIFSILVWAYEVIPTLSTPPNFFATRISNEVPWKINWAADTQPKWKDLQQKVFDSPMVWNSFYKQILHVDNHL